MRFFLLLNLLLNKYQILKIILKNYFKKRQVSKYSKNFVLKKQNSKNPVLQKLEILKTFKKL